MFLFPPPQFLLFPSSRFFIPLLHLLSKVWYQLNKTANDTKFMTIENGPQGPQRATRALYITVFFLYAGGWIARGAGARARLDGQQTMFSILKHICLQTMNKWHFLDIKENYLYTMRYRECRLEAKTEKAPSWLRQRQTHTDSKFSHHEQILLHLKTKLILNVITYQVKVHCCSSFLTTLSGHSVVSCWSPKSFNLCPFGP